MNPSVEPPSKVKGNAIIAGVVAGTAIALFAAGLPAASLADTLKVYAVSAVKPVITKDVSTPEGPVVCAVPPPS